jgi:endonuclease/exonuclease/phosphatase family metal-dependent hydrolase
LPFVIELSLNMRLLSYNIHKGIGGRDRRYSLERIIQVIEHEQPDIVCLQEVCCGYQRCSRDDQPQRLAEHFHAQSMLFQRNVELRTGCYGNLLLSRWQIDVKHQISLRLNTRKPRGAQIAIVETPEGPIKLVNLHLGLAERERHWQMSHLTSHRLFADVNGLPDLMAGDYNDWRNTLQRPLGRQGFHHVTGPPSRFRSFPAYLPLGALDKAFARGEIVVASARIATSKLARSASDHLPLVIDFHMNGAAKGDST